MNTIEFENRYECECRYKSHYFPVEWDSEWEKLRLGIPTGKRVERWILAKDCDGGFDHKVIVETEHFKLVQKL